jgi:uncharacterized protein (DUF4415 family)
MNSGKLQKSFQQGRGYSREDWDAVDSPELTDDELATLRPAREVLPPAFFEAVEREAAKRGRPPVESPKRQITLRLDEEIIQRYKQSGKGWQSRINDALRKSAGI